MKNADHSQIPLTKLDTFWFNLNEGCWFQKGNLNCDPLTTGLLDHFPCSEVLMLRILALVHSPKVPVVVWVIPLPHPSLEGDAE